MRDRLINRALFTVSALVAMALTTALILVVVGHGHGERLVVVRPAATASPVP